MNILIFNGSPRKGGNTDILIDKINQGIEDQGYTAETITIPKLDIHPCIGCGNCEKTGDCIFKDDMVELYEKIGKANRVIICSPIYFYGVTAQAKLFIDRLQALWSRKFILGQIRLGREQLKGYYVGVAATSGGKIFEGAALTVRYAYDAMDFNYSGEYLVRGIDSRGEIGTHQDHLEGAVQFGRDICAP